MSFPLRMGLPVLARSQNHLPACTTLPSARPLTLSNIKCPTSKSHQPKRYQSPTNLPSFQVPVQSQRTVLTATGETDGSAFSPESTIEFCMSPPNISKTYT